MKTKNETETTASSGSLPPLPPPVEEARLEYANACEMMGIAHAAGTREAWQTAVDREVRTRAALVTAIRSALAAAESEAREELRKTIAGADGLSLARGIAMLREYVSRREEEKAAAEAARAEARAWAVRWRRTATNHRSVLLTVRDVIYSEAWKQQGGAICSFCQHLSATREEMAQHMSECSKHPLRAAEARAEAAERERDEARQNAITFEYALGDVKSDLRVSEHVLAEIRAASGLPPGENIVAWAAREAALRGGVEALATKLEQDAATFRKCSEDMAAQGHYATAFDGAWGSAQEHAKDLRALLGVQPRREREQAPEVPAPSAPVALGGADANGDGNRAPYYLADGSSVMLPREEVTRRRKAAAVVIGEAQKWGEAYRKAIASPDRDYYAASLRVREREEALSAALDALGPEPAAPAPGGAAAGETEEADDVP